MTAINKVHNNVTFFINYQLGKITANILKAFQGNSFNHICS